MDHVSHFKVVSRYIIELIVFTCFVCCSVRQHLWFAECSSATISRAELHREEKLLQDTIKEKREDGGGKYGAENIYDFVF